MNSLIKLISDIGYKEANCIIKRLSGIVEFFASDIEKENFICSFDTELCTSCEDRVSYGDWQTPEKLADKICMRHVLKYGHPDIVIEPTCGLGAFVFAALKTFPELSEIHALDINRQYTSQLKLDLLLHALDTPESKHPDIYIYNADFFDFNFESIVQRSKTNNWNIAIIGNPPWVTNSQQGKGNSHNVPVKSNHYRLKGIDAITGKSNFDISENIVLELLNLSHSSKGGMSMLLKNSVIRNIVSKQHTNPLNVGDLEQSLIDASDEFGVSVDAACFYARFNRIPSLKCITTDFYTKRFINEYGWTNGAFVSDTSLYTAFSKYDRKSSYVWRSGIKHDCTAVLELTLIDGVLVNGLGETVQIEEDLVYPLLKSSDINKFKGDNFRRFLLVPQRNVGEDTSMLRHTHPQTYRYLTKHEEAFKQRKSSIYIGKDRFSVFGLGDYSFRPYKIAISSLYKTLCFKLILPYKAKPVMVDDTCYQLDFDNIEEAKKVLKALNSDEIQSLLKSLVFQDAKRVVTKSLLMRLDLGQLCRDKCIEMPSQRFMDSSCHQLSLFD